MKLSIISRPILPSVCEDALGIQRGLFNVTASSYWGPGYEPWRGRLNSPGIWCPISNNAKEFIQVSFDRVMDVTGVSTEGDDTSCGRVRRFYLYYSLDGLRFQQYIDPAVGDVSTKDFLTRATQTLAQAQGKAPVKRRMIVDFPLTIIKKS